MVEIMVFGGTSEGRELASLLKAKGVPSLVCVATEYGESLLEAGGSLGVHTGRLAKEDMAALMALHRPRLVIDATHPYAQAVSGNLRAACESAGVPCLRVRREPASQEEGLFAFPSLDMLIPWLNAAPGIIFSALGAKEAPALTAVAGFEKRVWLRILPFVQGLESCIQAGFPPKRIICMQGPFSQELNEAMFRTTGAHILLTKESGAAGGFGEKLSAAKACGMAVAVLTRPREAEGLSLEEIKQRLQGGAL
ncbi:MAG: precorrin-6A reductase [Candidatus Limiplasma sp.]|nr:precorrin-6A reductase [Candidatus Limiplasma sp.]